MQEIINKRIEDCNSEAERYGRTIRVLRVPNFLFVGLGSLLAFLGGAAIIADKFGDVAGYMALVGGAMTGFHGWLGCESYQQKCKSIESRFRSFRVKYEAIPRNSASGRLESLEEEFSEFVDEIDAKPLV